MAEGSKPPKQALPGGLYLVATPIGNAGDITLRALDVIARADVLACEDTRVSAKLLAAHAIRRTLISYHDHNAASMRPVILEHLRNGDSVALISDAGTPLVSDPGYKLVRQCREEGLDVTTVPGASSVLSALQLSALPSDRFLFVGFLPPKQAARRHALEDIKDIKATLVIMESAKRLPKMLGDAAHVLGEREACVTREMTKLFEEARSESLHNLADFYTQNGPPKGEVVVVVEGARAKDAPSDEALDALLGDALRDHTLRDAVDEVAHRTGVARKRVYRRALALPRETASPTDDA
ncbi:16S rRNA (cytidine(1402)-2'-O)-methyltransferase [Varunaivibrio sulfuroxidans]|uniref:Ribosomal RNA small subunit methyltransferase I n=1 Tax=Varunaivibrio sulfuroxidans TaxID=1773489 RepID=A0A4R3JG62_9PROT|nr:16S rRNA (cytidine(1402)-2'-O)-methyltransferase [Varunaivibrio sulfuroxidans]TCS64904.1 16S rRNA (cytidine1402-2'-O)-methyltransferase [Varunaivibrio sulfuroxidans]WES29802.1 16S rRNA (cytidine(1402)-2'-O)-methyltransferase [Varunaivibrio sulfuroxidans]